VLDRIFAGEKLGTAFLPSKRMRGKRRWIAYAADVRGKVVVDAGAYRAITERKASLLASGVVRVESHFAPLDVVSILDADGREFARGIAECASGDAEHAARRKKSQSAARLSARAASSPVLVTRDNIVLLMKP
jgi:glutamate 5-kinase